MWRNLHNWVSIPTSSNTGYPTCLAAARCVEAWLNYTSQWPALSEVLTHVSYILQSWGRLHILPSLNPKTRNKDFNSVCNVHATAMEALNWKQIYIDNGYWIYLPYHIWTKRKAYKTNLLFFTNLIYHIQYFFPYIIIQMHILKWESFKSS